MPGLAGVTIVAADAELLAVQALEHVEQIRVGYTRLHREFAHLATDIRKLVFVQVVQSRKHDQAVHGFALLDRGPAGV